MLHCRLPGSEKFRYNKNSSSRKHFLYQSVTREKERLFESFLNRLTVFATIQVPSFEIDDMTRADWKLGRVYFTWPEANKGGCRFHFYQSKIIPICTDTQRNSPTTGISWLWCSVLVSSWIWTAYIAYWGSIICSLSINTAGKYRDTINQPLPKILLLSIQHRDARINKQHQYYWW